MFADISSLGIFLGDILPSHHIYTNLCSLKFKARAVNDLVLNLDLGHF